MYENQLKYGKILYEVKPDVKVGLDVFPAAADETVVYKDIAGNVITREAIEADLEVIFERDGDLFWKKKSAAEPVQFRIYAADGNTVVFGKE